MFSLKTILRLNLVLLLGLLNLQQPASAHARHYKGQAVKTQSNPWFVGVGTGAGWVNFSQNTAVANGITIPPFTQDSYSINSPTTSILQFLFGYQWKPNKTLLHASSLYFQYRHYFQARIKGNIQEFSLPEFLNYNYKMNYEADLFTLTGKFNFAQLNRFSPFVTGGIGAVVNYVSDYTESAVAGVTPRTSPGFNSKNKTNLAFTLGTGFDVTLSKRFWLTFGYEHVFQYNTQSGPGNSSWSSTVLNFGNTKMDTAFVNISTNFAS